MKMWYIYKLDYYSPVKNAIIIFAGKWIKWKQLL